VVTAGNRVVAAHTRSSILAILDEVKDPEVPALSVVELGLVRDVEITGDTVNVVVTPTYSGCPAMKVIEDDVLAALHSRGISDAHVRTVYAPAWTTDWMTDEAREKLRAYGIAPPGRAGTGEAGGFVTIARRRAPVRCPFCGSTDTVLTSEFSSTACKALHACRHCSQPFEEFKAI
jgi:ring-1,2-phenylacetyl-CoA epoxidase subunit PaaD